MQGRRIRWFRHLRWFGILADIAAIPLAVFLAYLFRYGHNVGAGLSQHPTRWAPLLIVLSALVSWLGLYEFLSLDCFREGWCLRTTISRIVLATAILMGVVLALAYMAQLYYSRLVLAYFATLFCGLILLIRFVAHEILLRRHRAGRTRRAVIIGDGRIAHELAHRIERHPELLYHVVGMLNPSAEAGAQVNDAAVASRPLSSLDVAALLEEERVSELFVCLDHAPRELQTFLAYCRERQIRVNLVPQPYELFSSRVKILEIDGVPLISLEGLPDLAAVAIFKRAFDLLVGLPLAILDLPVLVASALVLRLQGRRLLRRELRCGQYGAQFWMYRLDVSRWDENANAFQRLLCKLSISELPQLWNVVKGQMSLVGPRPEPPERVSAYSDWQKQRLMVKPGMTGLAQVNGLREQHSSDEKARYDLQYIVRWTPVTDSVLLLETIWALVARSWSKPEIPLGPPAQVDKSAELSRAATD